MFTKIYLMLGLLSHAGMLALLLRFLEHTGVTVRESITGMLTQGATALAQASMVVEETGLYSSKILPPYPDRVDEEEDVFL